MSLLKNAMSWLGLGPDAEYEAMSQGGFVDPGLGPTRLPDGHAEPGRFEHEVDSVQPTGRAPAPRGLDHDGNEFSAVRPVGIAGHDPELGGPARMSNRSLRPVEVRDAPSELSMGSVRPVPASQVVKPQLVAPRVFEDAQQIGDLFRGGAPVILNFRDCSSDLSRRLIDFCSGLGYALHGSVEKVGDRVFLLTPSDVKLSAEDYRLMRESGLVG